MQNLSTTTTLPTLVIMCLSMLLSACGGGSDKENSSATLNGHYKPTANATWQWQLTGTINQRYDVDIYDIDLFDTDIETITQIKAAGRHVICYFSAGSYEPWRSDADQFSPSDLGYAMDGWPDERWLDIRSDNVADRITARLTLAVNKGCDGVEPDNVDGYTNDTGFSLTSADQLAFNKRLATEAHQLGLSIGLKNDLDQVSALVSYFDFAVNEQCSEYAECDALLPFIEANKPVLSAEYNSLYISDASARSALCNTMNDRGFSTLILSEDLDDSFRYSCQTP